VANKKVVTNVGRAELAQSNKHQANWVLRGTGREDGVIRVFIRGKDSRELLHSEARFFGEV